MYQILGPEVEGYVIPYVDDLLIYSKDVESHPIHLKSIFEKFRQAGITIKLNKSYFGRKTVKFLRHVISPLGISMDPDRIVAIEFSCATKRKAFEVIFRAVEL